MKEFLSVLLASVISALSVVPFSSGAIINTTGKDNLAEQGLVKLDEKYMPMYESWKQYYLDAEFYIKDDGTIITTKPYANNVYVCRLKYGIDEFDVNKMLEDELTFDARIYTIPGGGFTNTRNVYADRKNIKELADFLVNNELIDSFSCTDLLSITSIEGGYGDNCVHYKTPGFSSVSDKVTLEDVLEYAQNNGFKTETSTETRNNEERLTKVFVYTKSGTTIEEKLDTALEIYNALGVRPYTFSPTNFETLESNVVDVLNAVDGDANEDGNVNMADATAIVQAIGNPDKYALSPQGEFNADMDGDGLTGMDAIEIQMKVASAGMPE